MFVRSCAYLTKGKPLGDPSGVRQADRFDESV